MKYLQEALKSTNAAMRKRFKLRILGIILESPIIELMINRRDVREIVLKGLYATELSEDSGVKVFNNVIRRAFWDDLTIRVADLDAPVGISESTRVYDQKKQIDYKELKVGDWVDLEIWDDYEDEILAKRVRRVLEDDDRPKVVEEKDNRYWTQIVSIDDSFQFLSFAEELFGKTREHAEEADELIKNHIKNWDISRLALIDRLILHIAITELLYFNSIPANVTINEAIETAKKYSTTKSGRFVNGILDVILEQLVSEDRIKKTGRGLLN